MGRVQAGIRPEFNGENYIGRGGRGISRYLSTLLPCLGNVISFGVVSDSGRTGMDW